VDLDSEAGYKATKSLWQELQMEEAAKPAITILVIDDNPNIRDVFGRMLEMEGYSVLLAESGTRALSLMAEKGPPALAIVDLHMPGMSGFEFCEAALAKYELPIMIMTVADDQGTIVEGLDKYAEDYIVKPTSTAQLLARVRRVLQRVEASSG
jgi:DNA-binding response OmpR family regulator